MPKETAKQSKTVVFVTHNVREAVRLGDRVVLLSSRPGRVAAEFPVSTPRPRRMDSTVVAEQADESEEEAVFGDAVEKLHRDIVGVLKTPEVRDFFAAQGTDVIANTPEEFVRYVKGEAARWGEVVRASGATAD